MMYELSETGLQELLNDYGEEIPELEEYVSDFAENIIEYANIYTNFALENDLDTALGILCDDGYGWTTDAIQCIEELEGDVKSALLDNNIDIPEDAIFDY